MNDRRLTLELLGALVGAGMASGREIASFFGRHGPWGYGGAVLAAATIALLADAEMPHSWHNRWPERMWRTLSVLLLTATGAAMLAGAGEVAAMLSPLPGFRWGGMALTMMLAWLLARRTKTGLAWVSGVLVVGLFLMLGLAMGLSPMRAVAVQSQSHAGLWLRSVTYGGFNAALLQPLLATVQSPKQESKRALIGASFLLLGLLTAGLTALMRHPAMLTEPMPFLSMAAASGKIGRLLASLCLYLAILSTLTACIRALGGRLTPLTGMAALALLGFSGVVDVAYPVLGAGCVMMLVIMKAADIGANFGNSSRKTFQSPPGML